MPSGGMPPVRSKRGAVHTLSCSPHGLTIAIDHLVTGSIEALMPSTEGTKARALPPLAPGDCMASPATKVAPMSGADFKTRLRNLGRSHAAFAIEIGASLRSVDRWANSGPPPEVAYLVDLLTTLELHVVGRPSFPDQLDRLMERAANQGRLAEFVEATRRWYADRHIDDFDV